jgi:hypothetical protein
MVKPMAIKFKTKIAISVSRFILLYLLSHLTDDILSSVICATLTVSRPNAQGNRN